MSSFNNSYALLPSHSRLSNRAFTEILQRAFLHAESNELGIRAKHILNDHRTIRMDSPEAVQYFLMELVLLSQAAERKQTHNRAKFTRDSVRIQQALTVLFFVAPQRSRGKIWNLYRQLGVTKDAWVRACKGAFSVAIVGCALNDLRGRVLLSTPEQDRKGAIDLIAYLPQYNIPLCIQVKTVRSPLGVSLVDLDAFLSGRRSTKLENEINRLRNGARIAEKQDGIAYYPVIATVGGDYSFENKLSVPLNPLPDIVTE